MQFGRDLWRSSNPVSCSKPEWLNWIAYRLVATYYVVLWQCKFLGHHTSSWSVHWCGFCVCVHPPPVGQCWCEYAGAWIYGYSIQGACGVKAAYLFIFFSFSFLGRREGVCLYQFPFCAPFDIWIGGGMVGMCEDKGHRQDSGTSETSHQIVSLYLRGEPSQMLVEAELAAKLSWTESFVNLT